MSQVASLRRTYLMVQSGKWPENKNNVPVEKMDSDELGRERYESQFSCE